MDNIIEIAQVQIIGGRALYWMNRIDRFKEPATELINQTSHEAQKPYTKDDRDKNTDKLKNLIKESSNLLAEAKSFSLFSLTRNQIIIDRHKLTIIYRKFPNSEQTVSVPLENVKNIQTAVGLFFGSLTITSDHFVNNIQTISALRRTDVVKIQKLIQGAVLAIKGHVEINSIEEKDLKRLLSNLGESVSYKEARERQL